MVSTSTESEKGSGNIVLELSCGFGINCFHLDDGVSRFRVSYSNRSCDESITISIATQKLPGSVLDPKVSLNKTYAFLSMTVIAITANYHAVCSLIYEASRSCLLIRICVFGNLSWSAWIWWRILKKQKANVVGSISDFIQLILLDFWGGPVLIQSWSTLVFILVFPLSST